MAWFSGTNPGGYGPSQQEVMAVPDPGVGLRVVLKGGFFLDVALPGSEVQKLFRNHKEDVLEEVVGGRNADGGWTWQVKTAEIMCLHVLAQTQPAGSPPLVLQNNNPMWGTGRS